MIPLPAPDSEIAKRFGYWKGTYHCRVIGHRRRVFPLKPEEIWEFLQDVIDPLTYVGPDGVEYQPDRHFLTDFGSQPWPASILVGRYQFPRFFLLHDSAFQVDPERGEHGLWVKRPGADVFRCELVTRPQVNRLGWAMIRAEGGSAAAAWYVTSGLALWPFSAIAWRRHEDARRRGEKRIGVRLS